MDNPDVIVLSLLNLIMLKQQLQQKLQQKLSPQQIQLIRLLELPAIELEERVKHELEDNPALEEGKDFADDFERTDEGDGELASNEMEGGSETDTDLSLGDYMNEDDIPDYKLRELSERAEKKEDVPFSVSESLNEYLLQQLGLRDLQEKQVKIAEYIIGNIDDDGYLRRDLSAIADDLIFQAGQDVTEKEIEEVLTIIQDFDPAGVGARNLQECLLLQLVRREKTPGTMLATRMLTDFFEEFTRKHYDKIMRGLDIDEAALKKAIREITTLDPKPCVSWGSSMETVLSQIIPDFVVEAVGGELILNMNNRGIPDMRINREYVEMFQDYAGNKTNQTAQMKEAVQFVKQKLDSAQWFIDAIKQRQETLQRTMETIILLQRDFFLTGDEATLRPMILKDVAERAGYDISTISRVSNSKYVQTNFGIYPLKYFFSESMQTDSGEEISTREVKKIMKEHIDSEAQTAYRRRVSLDPERERLCHRPPHDSQISRTIGYSGCTAQKRNINLKRYEVIFKYHIGHVPSVANGDIWSRAGSHLHVSGNLSTGNETVACRRDIPVDNSYPRSVHLHDGKKRGGSRYGVVRPA